MGKGRFNGSAESGKRRSAEADDEMLVLVNPNDGLTPDTEENVSQETEDVVTSFMFERYSRELESDTSMPRLPDFASALRTPMSSNAQIGRQLARIGDEVNEKYADQFGEWIDSLQITPETAYENFAGVARKVFEKGQINWGRILMLMSFGYRIAVTILKEHAINFALYLKKIIGYVVKFIVSERIAKWIADHGGWAAVLQYIPRSMGWPSFGLVVGAAAVSVLAVILIKKYS